MKLVAVTRRGTKKGKKRSGRTLSRARIFILTAAENWREIVNHAKGNPTKPLLAVKVYGVWPPRPPTKGPAEHSRRKWNYAEKTKGEVNEDPFDLEARQTWGPCDQCFNNIGRPHCPGSLRRPACEKMTEEKGNRDIRLITSQWFIARQPGSGDLCHVFLFFSFLSSRPSFFLWSLVELGSWSCGWA